MIEVCGIKVPRVQMLEVAHRLVIRGNSDAAARVLQGLVDGGPMTLDGPERDAVVTVLDDEPPLLGQLRAVLLRANEEAADVEQSPEERHRFAAEEHEGRAARHEETAVFWEHHDEEELAAFERRNAAIERASAELENDRADHLDRAAVLPVVPPTGPSRKG